MKIIAIWERPRADKHYGSVFCLTEDNRFITVKQETEYNGTDKNGNAQYIETGNAEIGNAFDDKDCWSFKKADYFIRHFGGKLVWKSA